MESKISVNKLGEYMTASPARRKQIVKDQKNPAPFKVSRYKEARGAIVEFIESGLIDDDSALSTALDLRENLSGTDFVLQDRALSAEAIENFLDVSENIEIEGLLASGGDKFSSDIVDFGGTKVSMRPDALLRNSDTGEIVGCVKLHFSKSVPLSEKGAEYVATALRYHLEQNLSSSREVDPTKCYVVDIAAGTVTTAPKANKRRLSDLEAAGEEINSRWEKL